MLTGDGWITDKNEFGLSLQQSDKEYIYKLRDFLQSNHPIKSKINGLKKDGTESISYELRITNRKIVSDLRGYGFTNNKTHYIKFPNIDQQYLPNYMLGLIDSDGSINTKKIKNTNRTQLSFSFIGPTEFAKMFQMLLIKNCGISKTKLGIQKSTNFVRIVEYGGYKNIFKIVKFLYSQPTIWMERKKKIPNDLWLLNNSTLA
jgi:hypothetical protein